MMEAKQRAEDFVASLLAIKPEDVEGGDGMKVLKGILLMQIDHYFGLHHRKARVFFQK